MLTGSLGLFGTQQDPRLALAQAVPGYAPDPVASALAQPAQAFVWGGSGDRLTADDIARQEATARAETVAGTSSAPVQSWAQGLDRVAQALMGGFDQRAADKASAANVTANNQALAGLSQPGANEVSVASILADPTLSDGLHAYATAKLAGMTKAPPKLNEFQQALSDAGVGPGTPQYQALNLQYAQNKADPLQLVAGVDGDGNSVLRPMRASQLGTMGGGDPASTVPHAPVGKLTPIGGAGSGPRTFPLR